MKEQLIVRVKFKTCIHTCSNLEFQISQCLTCLTTNCDNWNVDQRRCGSDRSSLAWTKDVELAEVPLYIIGHRSTQFNTVQQGLTLMSEPCLYCHYANLWHVFCEVLWSSVKVLWNSKVEALIVSPIRVATLHVGTVGVKRTSGDVQKICGCSSCARGRRWKRGKGWKNWKSWSEQVRTRIYAESMQNQKNTTRYILSNLTYFLIFLGLQRYTCTAKDQKLCCCPHWPKRGLLPRPLAQRQQFQIDCEYVLRCLKCPGIAWSGPDLSCSKDKFGCSGSVRWRRLSKISYLS